MDRAESDDAHQQGILADALERRHSEIVERWLRRTRDDAHASDVSVTDLRDHIDEYLNRLIGLLRREGRADTTSTSIWVDIAREHALTRVRLGFDVGQVFHELVLLLRVTIDVLRTEGVLDVDQFERLLELIEPAMSTSIQSYVDSRDLAARRTEAEYISFVTHELRNPLATIAMAAEQLRESDVAPQKRAKLQDILDRNVERMSRLIDNVLLTERLEVGEVAVRPIETNVDVLVHDVVETTRRSATGKHLRFETHIQDLAIRADHDLTITVLEHLLENAVKYTDEGVIEFSVEDSPDDVTFHVRDNCGGISDEELGVIFEPFKRAHTNKPGTGIGLAVARRAAEAQGGSIHAESAERGCHFWFTLPKRHH
jgi:signal transduction histidine kinase